MIGLDTNVLVRLVVADDPDQTARASLDDYRAGRVELVDALMAHINRTRGCEATATFDRGAAKMSGFVAVP
jgi:predicted nucleic-acid-binding protein